jgi:hypothetical protein
MKDSLMVSGKYAYSGKTFYVASRKAWKDCSSKPYHYLGNSSFAVPEYWDMGHNWQQSLEQYLAEYCGRGHYREQSLEQCLTEYCGRGHYRQQSPEQWDAISGRSSYNLDLSLAFTAFSCEDSFKCQYLLWHETSIFNIIFKIKRPVILA